MTRSKTPITDLNYAVEHQKDLVAVWHEPRSGWYITEGKMRDVVIKQSMTVYDCIAHARMMYRSLDCRPDIEILADFVAVNWAQIYREDDEK